MNNNQWIPLYLLKPNTNRIVETKISDSKGERNIANLRFEKNHWWHDDMSMYVYYAPTHWREI
jgi:hypothetical protein